MQYTYNMAAVTEFCMKMTYEDPNMELICQKMTIIDSHLFITILLCMYPILKLIVGST